MKAKIKHWYSEGEPFVWLTAGAVSLSMIMVFGLLLLIAVRGLGHFWPHTVWSFDYQWEGETQQLMGVIHETESVSAQRLEEAGLSLPELEGNTDRHLVKIGNRQLNGADFRNLLEPLIQEKSVDDNALVIERMAYGNFYGFLDSVSESGNLVYSGQRVNSDLVARIERAKTLRERVYSIERKQIGSINYKLEKLRLQQTRLEREPQNSVHALEKIKFKRQQLEGQYALLQVELDQLNTQISRDSLTVHSSLGQVLTIPLSQVVRVYQPNNMSIVEKFLFYFSTLWDFVSTDPREANTEGGVFPAIFGTVLMVIIMTVLVTPLGVVAAVYLREYARDGMVVRFVRVAVNNLAGVPSIVYGVFGLGFFIYFVGHNVDQLLFSEALPAPTFGTPGLFWASLTLALLTLPVVIVSTEEGLSRVPREIREGSLALGATRAETLWHTVLPMASPAMMTGLILAIARAAGEVAPLMLVGVVKLASSLPVDGDFPYLHLERKFMHLGFHIYDVGFQSPNVEAARPLVYATALLLVVIIIVLNLVAIVIRNRLREKYRALQH